MSINVHVRSALGRVWAPVARALVRVGVTPDAVTVVGTLGVVAGALAFFPRGRLLVGTLVCTGFVFADMLDGAVARASGRHSKWGAFLDSTLDRAGDAAIFGGLVLWFAGGGASPMLAGLALSCLITGVIVSYAKARAESLGLRCDVGIAERAARVLIALVATGLSGLGVPYALSVGLWVLAVASAITVVQRFATVHRQVRQEERSAADPAAGHAGDHAGHHAGDHAGDHPGDRAGERPEGGSRGQAGGRAGRRSGGQARFT